MSPHHPPERHNTGVQFGHAIGDLGVGHDHEGARILTEAAVVGVADYADDLAGRLLKVGADPVANDNLLADGVFVGEELLRQGLVDEGNEGRAGGVLVSEFAAADHRNMEELVVVGGG